MGIGGVFERHRHWHSHRLGLRLFDLDRRGLRVFDLDRRADRHRARLFDLEPLGLRVFDHRIGTGTGIGAGLRRVVDIAETSGRAWPARAAFDPGGLGARALVAGRWSLVADVDNKTPRPFRGLGEAIGALRGRASQSAR